MKRGPYKILSTKNIYTNPWIHVHEDRVAKPDGKDGLFGVVEYSAGASIVALSEKNEVFLVREYAYALDEWSISLPQGGVDPGESPLQAAKRELKEEAGVEASEWREMGFINPYTMIIKGPIHLFLATHARIVSHHEPEFELITVPFETAVQWVMESKINHSGSSIALLKAKEFVIDKT